MSVGNVLICEYFPTNYHTSASRDAFIDVLSELEDFIDSVPFQHIIIGGDFNVDLNVSSYRNSVLDDFFHERNFICMTCFPIDHNYESDASRAHSWIDHFVCHESLLLMINPVTSLNCGSNQSYHLPISVVIDIPYVFSVTSASLIPQASTPDSTVTTNWSSITNILTTSGIAADCLFTTHTFR